MIWWLTACTFTVDFDNATPTDQALPIDDTSIDTTPTGPTGSTTETGTTPPVSGPAYVQGTQCFGWLPPKTDFPGSISLDPTSQLDGPTTFSGPTPKTVFVFSFGAMLDIVVDKAADTTVTPSSNPEVTVFASVDPKTEQLTVFSPCATPTCTSQPLRIVLPSRAETIVVFNERGNVNVTDSGDRDVVVGVVEGDVTITGPALGIQAEVQQGTLTVDTPSAEILDLNTSTGTLTVNAAASTELCAISDLGDLDLTISSPDRTAIQATNGDIQADFSERPSLLDVEVVVGSADIALPGGAYDINVDVVSPSTLTLEGITDDGSSSSRIEGHTLGTGMTLRAR